MTVRQLMDRAEIGELLVRYSRAVDRCDLALLRDIWADGAVLDYGSGQIDAQTWSEGLIRRLRAMHRTMHSLSNIHIALDGDEADAETYCTAYHQLAGTDAPRRMVVGGRYLDRLIRTPKGWRIARRIYVMDWNENEVSTALWNTGPYEKLTNVGSRWPDDASYR